MASSHLSEVDILAMLTASVEALEAEVKAQTKQVVRITVEGECKESKPPKHHCMVYYSDGTGISKYLTHNELVSDTYWPLIQSSSVKQHLQKNKEEESKVKPPRWVGLKMPGIGHITLTWFGANRTAEELKTISSDIDKLRKHLPITFQFGEWHVLGKPDDIKAGKGVDARECTMVDSTDNVYDALQEFHKKWYYHEEGEAEERKGRVLFHVTVGKQITKEELSKLHRCDVDDIFMK